MLLRAPGRDFFTGTNLWAEDGTIFLNQALSEGLSTLWTPYSGYLHVYPRLFAMPAAMDLALAPYIFALGWLAAFAWMCLVVQTTFREHGLGWPTTFVATLLLALQPNSGEGFFSIAYAQWFLGTGLVVLVILKERISSSPPALAGLLVAGLTGPFSILLLPLALCRLSASPRKAPAPMFLLAACGATQAILFVQAARLGGVVDLDVLHWLHALVVFFSFGASGITAWAGALFWAAVLVFFLKAAARRNQPNDAFFWKGLALLTFALLFLAAGLWMHKSSPLAMNPMGNSARFYIPPYSLMIIALPFFVPAGAARGLSHGLLLMICLVQFNADSMLHRSDLQFRSFAWLAKMGEPVIIPIHPQWAAYPGWHVHAGPDRRISGSGPGEARSEPLDWFAAPFSPAREQDAARIREKLSLGTDTQVMSIASPRPCAHGHAGVAANMDRPQAGWAALVWEDAQAGNGRLHVLRRYYPAGEVTMQFAFPSSPRLDVWLAPLFENGASSIGVIRMFCQTG